MIDDPVMVCTSTGMYSTDTTYRAEGNTRSQSDCGHCKLYSKLIHPIVRSKIPYEYQVAVLVLSSYAVLPVASFVSLIICCIGPFVL